MGVLLKDIDWLGEGSARETNKIPGTAFTGTSSKLFWLC